MNIIFLEPFVVYKFVLNAIFYLLETCTSLSKELCLKTAEGMIVDNIFHFLLYSNQSQPSIEAREPAIRVLTNLLRYHETSWHIWVVSTGINIYTYINYYIC